MKRLNETIDSVGKEMGYGCVMKLVQECWRESLERQGFLGGEFAIGPCVALTVPCRCKRPHKCKWCNGAGWLTPHVKHVKSNH